MKKIFKCLGLFCLSVAVAIGSFFVTKKETKTLTASADSSVEIYSFNGSNVFIPISASDNPETYTGYFNFCVKLSNSSGVTVDFAQSRFVLISRGSDNTALTLWQNAVYTDTDYNFTTANLTSTTGDTRNNIETYNYNYRHYVNPSSAFTLLYTLDEGFNCNVSYVELGHSGAYNYVSYTDFNNNSLVFYIDNSVPGIISLSNLDYRKYYVSLELSESQQYNQGYQDGLADNQQNIYDNGFSAGKIIGYNNGKTDGIASANNYTFVRLIGAVFDAPLQTFRGLLNFNILGINLLDFALSLITIALVVYIIRLIKGGR